MKELRKLAKIYDEILKNKTSRYIRQSFNQKEDTLFKLLKSDVSENSISKKLYNSTPSHQSYQSLKKSLLDKLRSIIITVNVGKALQKQRLECSRQFLVVKILTALKLRSISASMASKLLKKCMKYHMFHESAELARILSEHYSVFDKNPRKAEQHHRLSMDCIQTYSYELHYGWHYSYYRSLYGTGEFEKNLVNFQKTADELAGQLIGRSSRLGFYYFELRFFEFYIQKNLDAQVAICKEALRYFRTLDFKHDSIENIFVFHLIEVYLSFNRLNDAEKLIEEFLEKTDEKNAAYYRYQELLLRVNLYQGNIAKTESVFSYLKKNIRKLSNVYTRDRLIIYEMYLDILKGNEVNFRKINYNLNQVKQDKKGLHVPFLIGQAIYHYKKDPGKLIDKLDALNQYVYKYLKGEDFARTREFIDLLDKLLDAKPKVSGFQFSKPDEIQSNDIEIVAYEKLREFIMS